MPKVDNWHQCPLCSSSFAYETLLRHLKRRHGGEGRDQIAKLSAGRVEKVQGLADGLAQQQIECPECGSLFKLDHLGEHVMLEHDYTTIELCALLKNILPSGSNALKMIFNCTQCPSSFWTKRGLTSHLEDVHTKKDEDSVLFKGDGEHVCAVHNCNHRFNTPEEYVQHCGNAHEKELKQEFKIFNFSFDNIDDFLEWKSEMEERTWTTFRLKSAEDAQITAYECHQATFPTSKDPMCSVEKANIKPCTAFLKCRVRNDGSVEAVGCANHAGHSIDAKNLLLTLRQKEELRGLLSKGVSPADVINQMKEKYSEQSRLHFVTLTDIALLDESASAPGSSHNHTCSECYAKPRSLDQLRDHVSNDHNMEMKQEELTEPRKQGIKLSKAKAEDLYYICDHCEFTCFTRSVLESHLQVHHPDVIEESYVCLPKLSNISCPKCRMQFRTPYLFAVHCVGVHTTGMTDFSLMQISFNSWTQLEPWREMMERDTNSVFVKSGMQAWGTKLVHSYHCQFDKAVTALMHGEKENQKCINCPAFIELIEHEDGMLDCVACFGHLGHEIDGLPPEVIEKMDTVEHEEERQEVCFMCGSVSPPEIDAEICEDVKWCHCSDKDCHSIAHEWCTRLLGKNCSRCERGVLIVEL